MITNKRKLAEYCLRQLGSPVIQINVDDDQVTDRINDAIQKFNEFHGSGSERKFVFYAMTEKDIENKFITLDSAILSVSRMLPFNLSYAATNLDFQAFMVDIIDQIRSPARGIHNYYIAQSHLSMLEDMFNYAKSYNFNESTGRLLIDTDWSMFEVGFVIAIECFYAVNPVEFTRAFENQWLKAYATALIKKQWGTNLIKYQNFQLPSGITIDGMAILNEAKEEIAKLEEDLYNTWEFPVDMMMG